MIDAADLRNAFRLDLKTGQIFWKNPPRQHAERTGMEAGFPLRSKGKNKPYWMVRFNNATLKRSRVIYCITHGRWPTPCVDHINGNSLDDRPDNLRECTYSQNAANSKDKQRSCDLPRGVYLTKQGRFMARLTVSRKTKNLGTYDTEKQALAVYLKARKEAFGEFA